LNRNELDLYFVTLVTTNYFFKILKNDILEVIVI